MPLMRALLMKVVAFIEKGGGNRLGEKMFDEQVNIWTDPWDANAPVMPWDGGSMLPREKMSLVKNGKIESLQYSNFWAKKQGVPMKGRAGNTIMSGGDKSTEELIASTKKGILVTRTWYIRSVDPQSLLVTGLTRDGTFYIENGKVKPDQNFPLQREPSDDAEQHRRSR